MMQATRIPSSVTLPKLATLPARLALFGEGADPLAEVLRRKARAAQLDQLLLLLWGDPVKASEGLDGGLVAGHRQRRVGRDLGGEFDRGGLDLVVLGEPVDEPDPLGAFGVQVARR